MSRANYSVTCELGLQHFDDVRLGSAAARRAFLEVRRLVGLDDRLRTTRMRRTSPTTVEITLAVEVATSWEAFDLCRAVLRTAVHAAGGDTTGWELLRPEVASRRFGRRRAPTDLHHRPAAPDWTSISAAALRRGAAPSWLPPISETIARPPLVDTVIDLR